ncbi:hypothetical protein [Aeromonas veronii]|uniref:hypothetical protein n=1 Tax=Aeromonas veronii TaxID=654 RepID=UPI0032EB29DA
MKLGYNSGSCGSGKTSAVFKIINEVLKIKQHNFIIVQGTKILINSSVQTLQTVYGISATAIYSTGLPDDNVMDRVTDYIKAPTSNVLFITDKIFWRLNPSVLKNFTVYVDDVTTSLEFDKINDISPYLKQSARYEVFDDITSFNSSYEYVTATSKEQDGDILIEVRKKFKVTEQNDKFFMNRSWFDDEKVDQLRILAYKDLTKYLGLDITFMANDFENTLIYLANKDIFEKVELELRKRKVPYQDRIVVKYFSNSKLTTSYKNKNQDKLKAVYDYLNKELNGKKFYWTNNNKDGDQYSLVGDYISPNSRGLNEYQDYSACVWLASMHPDDSEIKSLEYLFGITREQVLQAREYEMLHQFIMRGCVRKYDSADTQVIYVFDERQAKSLVANPEYIDIGIDDDVVVKKNGRPPKANALDANRRKQVSRCLKTNPSLPEFLKWMDDIGATAIERGELMKRFEKKQNKGT